MAPERPPRILVAERSALVRTMFADILRSTGWDVVDTADGRDVLRSAAEDPPDVLLLGRQLEGLGGIDVLDRLREAEPTREIPVIFVTGNTGARELALGLEHGAYDYVRKPVEPEELVARVHNALRLSSLRKELAVRNAELERLAGTDILTGLANRRFADETLRNQVSAARRYRRGLAVVLVDVDRFKAVNDSHGHQAGDEVLRGVAARLRSGMRLEDLAARWGGEEFLLVLPDTPDPGTLCERLRRAVSDAPVPLPDDGALTVTASFGWAAWTGDDTVETLVGRADEALYAAKDAGRDRVCPG